MELLSQLGELFLEAVPTIILVFLFYLFLRANFFKPIEKILSERSARIEGSRAEAAEAQAMSQKKIDEYRDALRKAEAALYVEQEKSHQAALDERAREIRSARASAQERIRAAKDRITSEIAAARADLEKQTAALAGEIVRSVLARGSAPKPGVAQ